MLDPVFRVGRLRTRRVEPRNTPTVINAAFLFRNFWDGRANNIFNGIDPFGRRNAGAFNVSWNGSSFVNERIDLNNSSLASQAVGPPLSDKEMSCVGRNFPDVGRKLLDRRPLRYQFIAVDDSVLWADRHPTGYGLNATYRDLIQSAFHSRFWSGPAATPVVSGYTQMEYNFSLF